jgi:hypothetical protein
VSPRGEHVDRRGGLADPPCLADAIGLSAAMSGGTFTFTSVLARAHRDALERLLFFNPNQTKVVDGVAFVVRRYGIPRIDDEGERLRIRLDEPVEPQTLFVTAAPSGDDELAAVAVYTREDDALVVLFVALHEAYTSGGAHEHTGALNRIVDELKRIGGHVRGVKWLALYLGRPTPTRLALRRPVR